MEREGKSVLALFCVFKCLQIKSSETFESDVVYGTLSQKKKLAKLEEDYVGISKFQGKLELACVLFWVCLMTVLVTETSANVKTLCQIPFIPPFFKEKRKTFCIINEACALVAH